MSKVISLCFLRICSRMTLPVNMENKIQEMPRSVPKYCSADQITDEKGRTDRWRDRQTEGRMDRQIDLSSNPEKQRFTLLHL